MNRLKKIFKLKYIYTLLVMYYFYKYYTYDYNINTYVNEYFGIYKNVLNFILLGYIFSLYMQNKVKKMILKVRLFFLVVLSGATGYLYLFEKVNLSKNLESFDLDKCILENGVLNVNLGYIESYTFLHLYSLFEDKRVLLGILLSIIFISIVIIFGKIIREFLESILNYFKKKIIKRKERIRLELERRKMEEKRRKEEEIIAEINKTIEIYGDKDKMVKIFGEGEEK